MVHYTKHPRVLDALVGESLVLMNADGMEYFQLNETGKRIWNIVSNHPVSLEEICQQLVQEYAIDERSCLTSVERFVGRAVAMGFFQEV